MIVLKKELPRFGCDLTPEQFNSIIIELFEHMHAGWTDEELLKNPPSGMRYCDAVRSRCRCLGIPDELILGALLNTRKAKKRKRRIPKHPRTK